MCKLLIYITRKKKSFFLFYTPTFTKYTHQFIYFIHLFNKIFIFLQFFTSPPLSLIDPSLPTISPHPTTVITTQPASSSKTNPLNQKPNQFQIHSIPNPFITHPTRNPVKPNHHPPNPKPTDDLMIGEAFV